MTNDPYLALATADMTTWRVLERIYCTCDEHPDNRDPDCRFCAVEDEDA